MVKRLVFHGHNNFHVQVRKIKSTIYFALAAASELLPLAVAGALVWFQLLNAHHNSEFSDQTRTDCSESRVLYKHS